jgi:hypothetical protein
MALRNFKISVLLIILFVGIGCSSNHAETIPDPGGLSISPSLVGVSDWNPDGSPLAGQGALGLFNLSINPQQIEAELTPLRNVSLTDVLEIVDITNFLSLAPCSDCAKIKSISLDPDGHAVLTIGIKHPFPVGDPLKPVSGKNRSDLHVFNVEGIIVSNLDVISFPGKDAADFRLLNADGYTDYLDMPLDEIYPTDADIHPYITHFDDYSAGNFNPSDPKGFESVTTPPPSGNLVMPMGCDYNDQDYIFDLDEPVEFLFAVGCTYAVSAASKSQRFTPEYRVPQHNKKAASEISVIITNNQLGSGIPSSFANLEIHVVDISHGVEVGTNLDQMFAESNVSNITIDAPALFGTSVVISGSSVISGSGHDPSDPLVYEATIYNENSAVMGTYYGLVTVTDTYPPGQNISPLLNGMDGIKRVDPIANPLTGLFAIPSFVTYQVFRIDIGTGCGPITGTITSPSCPVTGVADGQSLTFEADASSSNGGDPVVLYEWDMDYDGSTFNVDDTGQSVVLGPFENPNCPDPDPVTYTVAVRGTDSCDPPNISVFATCDVTVDNCEDIYKNIPLRDDVAAWDLVVDPLDGRVLIIYSDGEVWQYKKDNSYQQPTPNGAYYDSDWEEIPVNCQSWDTGCDPNTPVTINKAFLGISDNHNFVLGYGWSYNHWVDRAWFDNVDGTDSNTAALIYRIVPKASWQCSYTIWEVIAWQTGGTFGNNFGCISACAVPDEVWISHASPANNYTVQYYSYKLNAPRAGLSNLWGPYVKGMEIDANNNGIWILEDTDYYCAQFTITGGTGGTYNYANSYFGTGTQSDADTSFHTPLDLTRTIDNRMLVLDNLSTGDYRIKSFDVTSSPGTFIAGLNLVDLIGPIKRIDCGEWDDPSDGNMLFVLHGSTTDGYYMSIYRESELPW